MNQKFRNFFEKSFSNFSERLLPDGNSRIGTLEFLRNKLFVSILYFSLIVASIVYIPSIFASIVTEAYTVGIYDTIAILIVIYLSFDKKLSLKSKKIIFSINIYILGIILFAFMGLKGPGIIVLICISTWIVLYYSRKAGIIAVILNGIISLVLMAIVPIQTFNFTFFREFSVLPWLVVNINIIAFNLLIILSISYLINHLNETLLHSTKLQQLLNIEKQQLIEAKHKAEESDRLKSAFLANMSHEIRTPMNGILGLSTLLNDPDLNLHERDEYIGLIQKSGRRMMNIINEIVEISKIEAGLTEIQLSNFNVFEQVDYVYKLLKPEAEDKNLNFILDIPEDLKNLLITTDIHKFNGVIINLVKNAVKYTDKGFIKFGFSLNHNFLQFFVEDSGIGIPQERINDIFKRFVQADVTDVQAREGAGLGLAISKSHIEMLGGTIWVESEVGKGSTFYFTITPEIKEKQLKKNE